MSDIREKLRNLRRLGYYKRRAQEELAELITAYQLLTVNVGVGGRSGKISDPVGNTVVKVYEARESYAETWQEFNDEVEEVKEMVKALPDELRRIVEDYYIRGKTIRYIANRMYYGRSTICRKLDSAINLLQKNQRGTNGTNNGL